MAEIFSFNEAVVAAANAFIATGGLTPTFTSVAVGTGSAAAPTYSFSGDPNTGIYNSASDQLAFATAGAQRWVITSGGSLLAGSDNALDIGASGANRPRNMYLGNDLQTGGDITVGASRALAWSTRGSISQATDGAYTFRNNAGTNTATMTVGASNLLTLNGGLSTGASIIVASNSSFAFQGRSGWLSPSDGVMRVANNAGTDFIRMILGPGDTSGVAIKKNGAAIDIRLGDDSAYAGFTAKDIVATGAMSATTSLAVGTFVRTTAKTVATLTAAATAGTGARSFVTDALGPTFGAAVVGGGTVDVPVYSDGTDWLVG